MEERNLKISPNKSGSGSITFRTTLPTKWIKAMGLNQENRDIKVSFDGEKIIIEKANND